MRCAADQRFESRCERFETEDPAAAEAIGELARDVADVGADVEDYLWRETWTQPPDVEADIDTNRSPRDPRAAHAAVFERILQNRFHAAPGASSEGSYPSDFARS